MEHLGNNGSPDLLAMPHCRPDQLTVRYDACGICFSDVKIVAAGGAHPRLQGRDLVASPVIPGHEVSVTVVQVGDELAGRFAVGQRFTIQPNMSYRGKRVALGYSLPGGLSEYGLVGPEILQGDGGCYLLPIPDRMGYAEAALTEPWGCVEAAYQIPVRCSLKEGGTAWFIGREGMGNEYDITDAFAGKGQPHLVVLTDLPRCLVSGLESHLRPNGVRVSIDDRLRPESYPTVATRHVGRRGFDDIVMFGAEDTRAVTIAASLLGVGGVLNLIGVGQLDPVEVDVGRIHYDNVQIVGAPGPSVLQGYTANMRRDLSPGGCVWFIGAGGPMGQMHVQRALEKSEGPARIMATNLRSPRIERITHTFGGMARERGVLLRTLTRRLLGEHAYQEATRDVMFSTSTGFDDIVMLAGDVQDVVEAWALLAPHGVLNLFAGLPRGSLARLDLRPVVHEGKRLVGSSGLSIVHQRSVLERVGEGKLEPNRSVAAVGDLNAVPEALAAVAEGRFAGKVVVFPHVRRVPLTGLEELGHTMPEVADKLEGGRFWSREAEEVMLASRLGVPWAAL